MLDEAILSNSSSRAQCNDVSAMLADAPGPDMVRHVADTLIRSLRDVEIRYAALEQRFLQSRRDLDALQEELAVVTVEANRDALTGLNNCRHFDRFIERAVGEITAGAALSVLMVDIDNFKEFNDKFGHVTGDSALRVVASAIKQSVRETDLIARYGGEEFAIILPNTALVEAVEVGERLRKAVMARKLKRRSTGEMLGVVTVSAGAASCRSDDTSRSLVDRADACLYQAKSMGRNRTCSETEWASQGAEHAA